ncbi:MAG TPA: GNAT family N-acetyltransferase [Candidatus Bathyarchaeia archaeon]|nr:GNAT family N-acetyltransferase [Candidatus Bathyarchaeia archaeon]
MITPKKVVIEKLNIKEIPEDFWDKYHLFNEKIHQEIFPNEPLISRNVVEKRIISDSPEYHWSRWIIYNDKTKKEIIASCTFGYTREDSPSYEENKGNSYFNIVIDNDFRRKGLGSFLLKKTAKILIEHGFKFAQTQTYFEPGIQFCKKYNATLVNIERDNRLYLNEVNWEMVTSWANEAQQKNPETRIEQFNTYPDSDILELTKLITIIESETPIQDEEKRWHEVFTPESWRKYEQHFEARGYTFYNMITREKDGTISGITGISTSSEENPHQIEQELTGVLKEYRGKGYGKWLKAQMLLLIRDNLPNKIHITTGNADHNVPMLSINTRLGFKQRYTISTFNFIIQDLLEILGKD